MNALKTFRYLFFIEGLCVFLQALTYTDGYGSDLKPPRLKATKHQNGTHKVKTAQTQIVVVNQFKIFY